MKQLSLFPQKKWEWTADDWETPETIAIALSKLVNSTDKIVLEPCASTGQIAKILTESNQVDCIEINPDRCNQGEINAPHCNWVNADYFGEFASCYDLIIGNPPFSRCIEFIERSLLLLKPHYDEARILFLLPIDWNCSKGRASAWKKLDAHIYHEYRIKGRVSFLDEHGVAQSKRQICDAVFDIRPRQERGGSKLFMLKPEILLTHPQTGEIYNLSGWAKKIGIAVSTLSERYHRYGNDIEKVLAPSRLSHGRAWSEEEDDYLIANCFAPCLYKKWNKKAIKMGWTKRSHSALESRIFILQQREKLPKRKGNAIAAVDSGWVNMATLANYLGVHPHTIHTFIANGLQSTKCNESKQIKINLKNFAKWATKPDGAALVANAIRNDALALTWLLVEIGNW